MRTHRSASVLIIAIGLMTACVALAFAFVTTTRSSLDSASDESLQVLARQSARAGTAHAIAVLVEDYLRSPNTPTHPRQRWFVGFGAIDTHRPGWETADSSDDHPAGREGSAADANGNDVSMDRLVYEPYTEYEGRASFREYIHASGAVISPGHARWIEPGHYHHDLARRPISFHLTHPAAADPSSKDPALRWGGEPWMPDLDQPLRYDEDFRSVATREEARYRQRYAVWIDDLQGHLLQNAVGPYVPGTYADAGVTPDRATDRGAREVDAAVVDAWSDTFTNLAICSGENSQWPLVFQFAGIGMASDWSNNHPRDYAKILSHFSPSGQPQTLDDWDRFLGVPPPGEPEGRYDTPFPLYPVDPPPGAQLSGASIGLRGPAYSWESYKWAARGDYAHQAYTWSPFGRAARQAAAPTRWDEGYSANPWRVNLPTASPDSLSRMWHAYLPVEARVYRYQQRTVSTTVHIDPNTGGQQWGGTSTSTVLPGFIATKTMIDLWSAPTFAPWFSWLGEPYPGMDPTGTLTGWRNDLGKGINVQSRWGNPSGIPRTNQHMWIGGPWNVTERNDPAIPERIVWAPGGVNFFAVSPGNAYVYHDSYWFDLTAAMLQTFGVAQAVWHDDLGGGWQGDPSAGRVRWPAVAGRPEFGGGAQLAIDRDADGDGVAESPSLLDSVAEVDRLFLMNLGEHWDYESAGRPTQPATGITIRSPATYLKRLSAFTPNHNIASLLAATDATIAITPDEARRMEMVVNDIRLSFFGASPQYPDFRGIDLDHDGTIWCNGYLNGRAAEEVPGYGPIVPGDRRFSLTGYLVFQQSRFFRMIVRGEVFDTFRQLPVATTDLETVVAIDPDGSIYDVHGAPTPSWSATAAANQGLDDTQILFQRWHRSLYQGSHSAIVR